MRIAARDTAELRHIVDVDGQLFGIEPSRVSAAVLRALAGIRGDIVQVVGEHEMPIRDGQSIRLLEDRVLFFRSRSDVAIAEWRRAA